MLFFVSLVTPVFRESKAKLSGSRNEFKSQTNLTANKRELSPKIPPKNQSIYCTYTVYRMFSDTYYTYIISIYYIC